MIDGRPDLRRVALGFAVSATLLSALLYVVGVRGVLAALDAASRPVLVVVPVVVAAWIGVWAGSLHLVFRAFGVRVTYRRSVGVFATMMFWDNVTPFSTFAADPVAAWTVARSTDLDYDRALATVVAVDALNFAPAPVLAVVGLLYVRLTAGVAETVVTAMAWLAGTLLMLAVIGLGAWRWRRPLVAAGTALLDRVARLVGRVVPGTNWPDRAGLDHRLATLLADVETVAADPRLLAVVSVCAVVGWLALAFVFWLSILAVGHAVPVAVAMVLVPLVSAAELAPVPGGVGGVEPLTVVLLVALAGLPAADATAAVLLFRVGSYWLPVVAGGAAVPLVSRW
jgi:hypothetical protein